MKRLEATVSLSTLIFILKICMQNEYVQWKEGGSGFWALKMSSYLPVCFEFISH